MHASHRSGCSFQTSRRRVGAAAGERRGSPPPADLHIGTSVVDAAQAAAQATVAAQNKVSVNAGWNPSMHATKHFKTLTADQTIHDDSHHRPRCIVMSLASSKLVSTLPLTLMTVNTLRHLRTRLWNCGEACLVRCCAMTTPNTIDASTSIIPHSCRHTLYETVCRQPPQRYPIIPAHISPAPHVNDLVVLALARVYGWIPLAVPFGLIRGLGFLSSSYITSIQVGGNRASLKPCRWASLI